MEIPERAAPTQKRIMGENSRPLLRTHFQFSDSSAHYRVSSCSFGPGLGDAGGMLSGAFLIPLGILVRRYSKYIDTKRERVESEEEEENGRH